MKHKFNLFNILLPLVSFFVFGCQAVAEQAPPPPLPETSERFTQAELDQMLAPIALYPDALLSQVLMAATYPLEVVEASRWSKETDLDGEQAVDAAQQQNWDISIKSLVAFPDLIQLMDEQLSWTRRLGDAFLLQEEQVMETVQLLRRRSLEEGNLESLDHLVVRDEGDVIIVEPREVEVVYVPYYNTRYVYGDWWWYDYPPVHWNYPHYRYNRFGFGWSIGWHVSSRFYFSFCDWNHWDIVLHHHRWNHGHHRRPIRKDIHYVHHDGDRGYRSGHGNRPVGRDETASSPGRDGANDIKRWSHNPYHRRGVEYRGNYLTGTSEGDGSVALSTSSRKSKTSQAQRSNLKRERIPRTSTRRADTSSITGSSRSLPSLSRRSTPSTSSSIPTSRNRQSGSIRSGSSQRDLQSRSSASESRTRISTSPRSSTRAQSPTSSSRSYDRPSTSRSYTRSDSSRSAPSASSSRSYSRSSRSSQPSPAPSASRSYSSSSSSRSTPSVSSSRSTPSASSSRSYSRSSSNSTSSRSYSDRSSSSSTRGPSRSSGSSYKSARSITRTER